MLSLGPKREEAAKLGEQAAQPRSVAFRTPGRSRRRRRSTPQFPVDYQQLVVLGKAVPASDETSSLLVQLTGIAERAHVQFSSIHLGSEGGGGEERQRRRPRAARREPVSADRGRRLAAAARRDDRPRRPRGDALLLTFNGNFFQIADFIKGIDSMVKSHNEGVAVDGRLVTLNGFSLSSSESGEPGESGSGGDSLTASFSVTTYLTPPDQGVTAGASPVGPEEATATPASATTGGTP